MPRRYRPEKRIVELHMNSLSWRAQLKSSLWKMLANIMFTCRVPIFLDLVQSAWSGKYLDLCFWEN